MLKPFSEKLSFLIENIFMSTNASGLAIMDSMGDLAAECGNVDVRAASEVLRKSCSDTQSILKFFTGILDDGFFTLTKGEKGGFVMAKLNERFFLIVFYPKEVDLLDIAPELKKFAEEVKTLFKGV
jgi:hypothetical protein